MSELDPGRDERRKHIQEQIFQRFQTYTWRSWYLRYGVAIAAVSVALLLRALLGPFLHDKLTFVPFLVATTVAAWFGGLGPSRLTAVLGFAAAEYFFVRHDGAWWILSPPNIALTVSYFAGAAIVVLLSHTTQRHREDALIRQEELKREIGARVQAETELRKAHDELELRVRQQTAELNSAMQSVERQRRQFEEVLDRLPVCVALWAPDHHLAFANRLFRDRFGESNGRRCFEYVSGPSAACEFCESCRVVESGESHQWESDGPNGNVYQVFAFPYTDPAKSAFILEVKIDITEIKRAHERLSEQAALLDLAHDAILVTDLNGKISLWNPGAEVIYGWRCDEAVGANVHELIGTAFPVSMNEVQTLIQDQGQWEGELDHVTRNGRIVTVTSRWSLQRDREGNPSVVLAINRDVTERNRAQQALRYSEERYRALVEATSQIVWTTDPAGQVNDIPSWRAFTGQSEEEVKGAGWLDALHPDDRQRASERWSHAVRHQSVYEIRYRIRRHDGELRHLSVRGIPVLRSAGSVREWIGSCIDVTEKLHAEEALQEANRKLHQLSRDLLRAQDYERRRIARELHDSTSQLLTALSINLSRLEETDMDPACRIQILSEAKELAEGAFREIRTVTCLLHPPQLDAVGLVAALRSYAQGFNERTGIRVDINIPPDFGRLPNVQEGAFFRIVQEGLSNVHKHAGSSLAVIRLERNSLEVRLILQDEGHGLPIGNNDPPGGFVRFGIGVIGMRERAEQLGGHLELISNESGTRLTVTLPVVIPNEENANTSSR